MDLGTRLFTWRTHMKLTLQEVSKRIDFVLSQPSLTRLECGDDKVRWFALEAIITKALRISVARFFGAVPKIHLPAPRGRPRTRSRPLVARSA